MAKITRTGEYLLVKEAAEFIGIRPERIRQVIRGGRMPAVRFGVFDLVHINDAEQWRQLRAEGHSNKPIVITADVSDGGEDAHE